MSLRSEHRARIASIERVTPRIKKFTLECASGGQLPAWSGGSHIQVTMTGAERSWCNSYSLIGTPGETQFYQIAVRREDPQRSRGGSLFLHEQAQPGDVLKISAPGSGFPLARHAKKHVLIAGGIGITPFLAQMAALKKSGAAYELHYTFKNWTEGAFRHQLCDTYGPHVRFYVSAEGARLSPPAVLARQPLGTHVYVCGPHSLITAVCTAAAEEGWPASQVHSEEFSPPPVSASVPFLASLPALGLDIEVGVQETLLDALERAGVAIASSCRVGQCGTCEIHVDSGVPDHRDRCLTDDERQSGRMIACVSRCRGERLTLALPGWEKQ